MAAWNGAVLWKDILISMQSPTEVSGFVFADWNIRSPALAVKSMDIHYSLGWTKFNIFYVHNNAAGLHYSEFFYMWRMCKCELQQKPTGATAEHENIRNMWNNTFLS